MKSLSGLFTFVVYRTFMCLFKICSIVLLAAFITGCNSGDTKRSGTDASRVKELILNAEQERQNNNERLQSALKADSAARRVGSVEDRIATAKLVATAFARLDSSEQAKKYYYHVIDLATRNADHKNRGIALNNLGAICNSLSEYDSAILYYGDAISVFRAEGNHLQAAQAMINIGIVHKIQQNFDEAVAVSLVAARLLDSLHADRDLASVYTTLGNIFKELHRYDEALNYLKLALQLRTTNLDSAGIASAFNNIGNVHKAREQYDTALAYYTRSLELKEKLHLGKAAGTTLHNIADIYLVRQQYDRAEYYLKKALQVKNSAKDKEGYISALNKLNKLYLAQDDLVSANAIAMVADSLMPQSGFYGLRAEHAFLLSDIFYRKKLYDRSIQYSRHGLLLRDSLFDKDMAAVVSRLNISYKTALRERELFLAKQMQTEQSYRLTRQSYFIGFLVFILVFLASVAVLLYRAAQFRKKAKLRVDLLMAELSHRVKNNLQLLSGMLNMQMANATDESQQSTIRAINSRIQSIGILHSLLESDVDTGTVNMRGFIESLSANLRLAYAGRANQFSISSEVDEIWLFSKQAIPLGLIVNELVTNIFKYADLSGEPQLKISLHVSGNNCVLVVQDNCGFWEKKQPTTRTGGFGLVLVDTLVQQLDARYERTIDEQGTKHVVEFTKIG